MTRRGMDGVYSFSHDRLTPLKAEASAACIVRSAFMTINGRQRSDGAQWATS